MWLPRLLFAVAGTLTLVPTADVVIAQDGSAAPSPDIQAPGQASDLASRFPQTIDGRDLEVEVFSGTEWLARSGPETLEGVETLEQSEVLFAAAGRSVEDLTVATAMHEPSPGNVATIAAVRLRGSEAYEFVEPVIGFFRSDVTDPRLRFRHIADKSVLTVRDASTPGTYPVTVYPEGETVWFIDAGGPLREQILRDLPQAPPRSAAYDLAAVFPKTIGGGRRDAFFVSSGWTLPLVTRIPLRLEGLAEELFLLTGAGHYEVTTASGMSDEAGFSTLLNAYQVAGANEAMMHRVLEEIFLPRFRGGQVLAEPVEVAGRDLVLITIVGRRGGPTEQVHAYVSDDTIWMLEAEEPHLTELVDQIP